MPKVAKVTHEGRRVTVEYVETQRPDALYGDIENNDHTFVARKAIVDGHFFFVDRAIEYLVDMVGMTPKESREYLLSLPRKRFRTDVLCTGWVDVLGIVQGRFSEVISHRPGHDVKLPSPAWQKPPRGAGRVAPILPIHQRRAVYN